MRKIILIIAVSAIFAIGASAQSMTVDQILDKHFKAIGMEQLVKQKSLKFTGKQSLQGMEFPFSMYRCRPNKLRIEVNASGMKIVQVVNGDKGFTINPMTGSNEPQDIPEKSLPSLQKQADMDGILYKYAEKGFEVELEGEEDIDSKKAYKLKVTDKSINEFAYFFISKDDFMLMRVSKSKNINGQEIKVNTNYSDYKKVDGVSIAFVTKVMIGTMLASKNTVESAKFNEDMPDSLFNKPE